MAIHLSPGIRRIAVAIVVLLVFVTLVGATYQGVVTALERREFQRPGGLVDAGGFQLHIYCVGQGSPTVLLEAAAGSMSQAWGWIQPDVARMTRVCSYDRAGLGWSETRDGEYTPSRVPEDLHTLLEHAGEQGPFVLVGHELGAAFARMFASQYPGQTAGLVLVDDLPDGPAETAHVAAWPWLARVGILRATGGPSSSATLLPGKWRGAMRAFLNRPDHLTRAAMEISRTDAVVRNAVARKLDPSVTIVSVSVDHQSPPAMLANRDEAMRVTDAVGEIVTKLRERVSSSPGR